MKTKSLARKLLIRCIVILMIAFSLFLSITYYSVKKVINEDCINYAKSILWMYCDTVMYLSSEHNIPIDLEHREYAKLVSDYVCQWHNLDYAFMCIPDIENNTVQYINLSYSSNATEDEQNTLKNYTANKPIPYNMSSDEIRMLNGEIPYSVINTQTTLGKQLEVSTYIIDDYGNVIMAGVDMSYAEITKTINTSFLKSALFLLGIMLILLICVYYFLKRDVHIPARKIADRMDEYIVNGTLNKNKLEVKGNDEFAKICIAFNNMTDDISEYIESNHRLLMENKQKQVEIDIAGNIQQGLLPSKSLILDDFNIFATMIPAKDIGGDLYDYYPLDDTKTLIVIADVSGKGFPASIFMGITMTLFKQYAKLGLSPAEIFEYSNNSLSEKNPKLMFTTAFLGIYDNNTRTLTYSNAGHNLPYIISDDVHNLSDAVGCILGVFPDEKYENATVELKNGDIIFLYTDGVTEARNKQSNFFGDNRLKECLTSYKTTTGIDIVEYMLEKISQFSNGEEQSDDITMLSLVTKECSRMILKPDVHEFTIIKERILAADISHELKLNLCVIAEEIFTNICNYAFSESLDSKKEPPEISFYFEHSYKIVLEFIDNGIPFDPTQNVNDVEDYDIDTTIGGLGRFIAFSIADDVKYELKNNKNTLTLTKYLKEV